MGRKFNTVSWRQGNINLLDPTEVYDIVTFTWADDAPGEVNAVRTFEAPEEYGLWIYEGDPLEQMLAIQYYLKKHPVWATTDYNAWVNAAIPYLESVRDRDVIEEYKHKIQETKTRLELLEHELDEFLANNPQP